MTQDTTRIRRRDGVTQRYRTGTAKVIPKPSPSTPSAHQQREGSDPSAAFLTAVSVQKKSIPRPTPRMRQSTNTAEEEAVYASDGERNAKMAAKDRTDRARQKAEAATTDAIILAGYAERSANEAKSAMERSPDDEFSAHLQRTAIRQKAEAEQAAELATKLDPQGFPSEFAAHMKRRAQRAAELHTKREPGQLGADEQQDQQDQPDFY